MKLYRRQLLKVEPLLSDEDSVFLRKLRMVSRGSSILLEKKNSLGSLRREDLRYASGFFLSDRDRVVLCDQRNGVDLVVVDQSNLPWEDMKETFWDLYCRKSDQRIIFKYYHQYHTSEFTYLWKVGWRSVGEIQSLTTKQFLRIFREFFGRVWEDYSEVLSRLVVELI